MVEVKGGRILVIDRDAPTRAARARILRDAGHSVFESGHLNDAALLLRQTHPELLVLDAALHDSRGAELRRALEEDEDYHGTMVLRISSNSATRDGHVSHANGLDRDNDRVRAPDRRGLDQHGLDRREPDADGYLVEPVPPGVLVATAHALLRLSRAERALRDTAALEQRARDEVDAANRVKDDFLGTLSHELRTPLHAIVGWVALLRTRPFDDEARTRALEVIERNARAQTVLIEDLLDVSRITLGQLKLTWGPVELLPILFSAVDAIQPTAEAKGVTISTDIALDPDITVRGDATRLRQVFWNLLSNAIKFTPEGGHVDVRAHAADGHAEIEVTDTGRGISPEFLPHMFERFGRAQRGIIANVDRGLGLGLAIARELVELHGGALTAASAGLNQGATFLVTLPYLSARAPSRPRAAHHLSGRSRTRPA
jgi:signal transduction histidine kinase